MDLHRLDLFLAVVRQGSFSAVARERVLDPSSVSRSIAELESELGVRLFQRTTRRMALTEAGHIYFSRIEPLVEELARAGAVAAENSRTVQGTLRMTASVTFGQEMILPLLKDFRTRYPDLGLECLFTDANVDLIAERIDLAIRLAPVIEGDLVAAKLMDTRYRVVASPGYVAAAAPLAEPADLRHHRCLFFNIKAFQTQWLFRDGSGSTIAVPVDGDIVISPAGSLRSAAIDDLGPALLPDWLVDDDIAAGRLRNLFPDFAITATTFDTAAWIVYPSRSYLPGKVRAMIDFLRARFPARR